MVLFGGGAFAVFVNQASGYAAWIIVLVILVAQTIRIGEYRRAQAAQKRAAAGALASPSPAPSVEKVIVERQVVVTRCRYCKELTPVDLTECKSCGARL